MTIDLDAIRTRQAELDAIDSKIAARLEEIAKLLRTVVSIRISVTLSDGGELLFGKLDGNWTFIYCDGSEDADDVRLASAPRDVRAEMLVDGHIERLVDSACAQLTAQLAERDQALAIADRLVGDLEQQGTK